MNLPRNMARRMLVAKGFGDQKLPRMGKRPMLVPSNIDVTLGAPILGFRKVDEKTYFLEVLENEVWVPAWESDWLMKFNKEMSQKEKELGIDIGSETV